ncbi:MAG: TonB-dependent receptor [Bacteroidales bacterium]|nr:TonB-dependent receptor [Bacteroidales bacterium]MCF8343862.1 TonB-dependent receptor [Bacteroidales bacterium]MCF8375145.1 TonB-dependent receptor [Bacteroidales bacterium]MCF8400052.1 TonB-dependent receptor [Bacteroidales bacterium]
MKRIVIIILFNLLFLHSQAQQLSGRVTDRKGNPLPGANVLIEGSYDGASTDENGLFSFKTKLSGEQSLLVRFVGFREYRQPVSLDGSDIKLDISLAESSQSLDAVVITAGSFEAGDRKKAVVLKPLDIVTTAGGLADIYGALQTLPGTQVVGEEGKIFVRGGDSYETKTFFDGLPVEKPYYAQIPDIPTRGRFSPWLFSGTVFSSGGYSAEYGQALSSALILESEGLPEQDVTSISLMTVGLGASHTKRWKKTSLSLSGNYSNLGPYFGLVEQEFEWEIAPRGFEGNVIFRQQAGKNGLIKAYGSYGNGRNKLLNPTTANPDELQQIDLKDNNSYLNATYTDILSDKWLSYAGFAYSNDRSDYAFDEDRLDEMVRVAQGKYRLTYLAGELLKLKFGGIFQHKQYDQKFFVFDENQNYHTAFTDNQSALFAESEFTIGSSFAFRLGGRLEYSSLLDRINLAPRFSTALKTSDNSQLSFAWGIFYQTPEDEFVRFAPGLNYEKAAHYILNYQLTKNKKIFRVEAYYKDYRNLVKFDSLHSPIPESYDNKGKGYARGIDLFWRDNSITRFDYWLSYGYIDTKRDYLFFPEEATPDFVSDHNFRAVGKYFVSQINSQVGLTYTFASGRPYNDPNKKDFMDERTIAYHDVSLNISYLTSLWDNFTVVYFSIGNLLDREHVFGYNYSPNPNEQGIYEPMAVKPMAKRFIFLGVFISLTE